MPGNEVGDRVHNFFAPDNFSQGEHLSQVVDGKWPVLNNNLWAGSQRQIGVPNSDPKNYSPQQSDLERGQSSHPLNVTHGLHLAQSTLRAGFGDSQSQSQQPNLNGFMYGHQVFQTRQDEANFLGVDTEPDRHNLTSRGLSIYESEQGSGHTKTSVRSETSESPVSFDFFGGQQQMSGQHPGMLQSGFNDMQQLHQQVMFRKMQELQRQKELRQQNPVNRVSSFGRQASGNHSHALINGTPISAASSNYPWVTDLTAGNTNWRQRASPTMQGSSSSGLVFSSEQDQAPRSLDFVHQQVDQSLYGVPVSSSRASLSQYHHNATDKPSLQEMPTHSNSHPGNQYAVFPEQVTMQDGTLTSRQGFQGKNVFAHASGQGLDIRGINMENKLQQRNPLQRSGPVQEFQGRQELVVPPEIVQEKTALQASSSQNTVALDPTEEKILFGSDGNIWDAFGRSTNVNGGASNLLDGTGFLNGFPSVQSGSWSALMQSAVAETSSSDIGIQEEWTGLASPNPELPSGNHRPSAFNNCGNGQTALGDDNLQSTPALNFGSVIISEDADINNNYQSVQGFQQFGQKIPHEHGERLQINSSRPIHQSSGGGSNWLNRGLQKPLAEGSQIYGNASHSVDAEMNAKNISAHWTPQQSGSSQPRNKPNNWNGMESVSPTLDASLNIYENENSLQHSHDRKREIHEEISHGDGIWKVNSVPNSTAELEPVKSNVGSPQMNREASSLNNVAAIPNSCTSRAGEETNQLLPNSHHLNYWKHVDSMVKFKESEHSGKSLHHLNKGPQASESSLNISDKEEVKMHEMENCNKKENSNDSYRSNLSHHTSAGGLRENVLSDASDSRTLPSGKQKSSNQVGRRTSGARKFQYHPMGNLDEDVEPSYGMRQAALSLAMSQQNSRGLKSQDQGYFGQSKLFGQVPTNSTEMKKGQLPDLQGDPKGFDEAHSRGILPGHVPNMSAPFDISVGMFAPNKASQSSQNMLELLHKVDQSRDHESMTHFSSSERHPSSDMPAAENSDGSGGRLHHSQSSASQGFGLQLGPPSQMLPVPEIVNSFSSTQATPDTRDKGHTQLAPTTSVQSLPPHETSQEDFRNNRVGIPGQTGSESSLYKLSGNFSSAFNSGFPYSRNQLRDQHITGARGQLATNQSINVYFDKHAPQSKEADDSCSRLTGQSAEASLPDAVGSIPCDYIASSGDSSRLSSINHPRETVPAPKVLTGDAFSVSQPFTTSGICQQGAFSKMLPNKWTNVPAQQHFLGAQARKVPSYLSKSHQLNIRESTSSVQQDLEDQDAEKIGTVRLDFGASSVNSQGFVCGEEQTTKESPCQQVSSGNIDLVQKMDESQGKETIVKHFSDASLENPSSTQRDIEAFGRSLKPNNFHQNYSLLSQMGAMKNAETDPSNRGLKRLKGLDNILGAQQVAPKAGEPNERNDSMAGDAIVSHTEVPSRDSKMLSFSGPADNLESNASSQLGNVHSQDMLAFGQNESQNYSHGNNTASVRVEHTQISPQMAPSWFNQYGTLTNGKMLHMYDAHKAVTTKTTEQPSTCGKSSGSLHTHNSSEQVNTSADTNQFDNILKSSTHASVGIERLSSLQSSSPDIGGQNFLALRPKKRKSAASELHPWHKEVSQDSQCLETISMAETDWANAASRLTEKVEDGAETIEDGPPRLRPKRRLILTTQLMQQLLRPPPAAVLSADANSNYESVAYFVARLALGDACSLVSCSRNYSNEPPREANFLSDKCKMSERIDDQHLSEVMEDFLGRARKLENDLLRLDKRASILDLRVECQDVEKFSVINRFAKFHGRGQGDGAETSLSSNAAANAQKLFSQRYVTALPLPRNLPDRVQCLSL